MTKYKIGMVLQSKTSAVRIKLTSRYNGNGHWNSTKVNEGSSNKNHRVHETTLNKFYEVVE
jgi:hypothetical protein